LLGDLLRAAGHQNDGDGWIFRPLTKDTFTGVIGSGKLTHPAP
jgi:hypothetical protein